MKNLDKHVLIQNITRLKKNKDITQEKLAAELGMSQSNISKALNESNPKLFTIDQIMGLAEYFNVSIDELVGNTSSSHSKLSPRATAAFIADLLEHQDAEITSFSTTEEVIGLPNGPRAAFSSKLCRELKKNDYLAFYLPSYWRIPTGHSEKEQDAKNEAYQCGNDTRMKPVNDFLSSYVEVLKLYKNNTFTEEAYRIILNGLLNRLKD